MTAGISSQELEPRIGARVKGQWPVPRVKGRVRGQESETVIGARQGGYKAGHRAGAGALPAMGEFFEQPEPCHWS